MTASHASHRFAKPDLPTDWGALCLLVFFLGMRRGVDADHLAAINGFARLALQPARCNARRRDGAHVTGYSRYCGMLFCLRHTVLRAEPRAMVAPVGSKGPLLLRLAPADGLAALASRVTGLAVAGASLLVAAVGTASLLAPAFDGWSDGRELAFGGIIVLGLALSSSAASLLARRGNRVGAAEVPSPSASRRAALA